MTLQEQMDHDYDQLNGFGSTEPLPYDADHYDVLDGSDLYIPSDQEVIEHIQARLNDLRLKGERGTLTKADLDESVLLAAEELVRLDQARITELEEVDPKYAQAVEEWIEIALQEKKQDEYRDLKDEIEIAEQLVIELEQDDEDPALIEMAHANLRTRVNKLTLAQFQELYAQAA